jgi:hypothetical protein
MDVFLVVDKYGKPVGVFGSADGAMGSMPGVEWREHVRKGMEHVLFAGYLTGRLSWRVEMWEVQEVSNSAHEVSYPDQGRSFVPLTEEEVAAIFAKKNESESDPASDVERSAPESGVVVPMQDGSVYEWKKVGPPVE